VVRLRLSALTCEERHGFGRRGCRETPSVDQAVQYFINTLMKDTNCYEGV